MAFKVTQWFLSNEKSEDNEYKNLEAGYQHLYITDANHDADTDIYTINVKSLENDGTARLQYYLTQKDGQKNAKARGTLISLGKALAGVEIGIPFFDDIKHGIVCATVEMSKPNDEGKSYPRIYKFEASDRQTWEDCKDAGMDLIEQEFSD